MRDMGVGIMLIIEKYTGVGWEEIVMKNFRFKIFLKYLAKYLCVVVVFSILLMYLYIAMFNITKQNILKDEYSTLSKSVSILNQKIEAAISITQNIQKSSYLQRFYQLDRELQPEEYYSMIRVQNDINNLKMQYDIDCCVYILFKNNHLFISDTMISPEYESIFSHFLCYEKEDVAALREKALQTSEPIQFVETQMVHYLNGQDIYALTCIMKPMGRVSANYTIIYTLDMADFVASLDSLEDEQQFVVITDGDGNILLDRRYGRESFPVSPKEAEEITLDGVDYTVLSVQSEYLGLAVIKGMQTEVFESELATILRIVKLYIICVLFFSVLLSFLLSFRQYSGINKVLDSLEAREEPSPGSSEYTYISSAVQTVLGENQRYELECADLKKSIRNRLFEKALQLGVYTRDEKEEFIKYVGCDVDFFCVVSLNVPNRAGRTGESAETELLLTKLFYFSKEKIAQHFPYTVSMHLGISELDILILLKDNDSSDCQKIYLVMQEVGEEILASFGCPVEIGISRIGCGIENIRTCYLQARQAIRQVSEGSGFIVCLAGQPYEDSNITEELNIERQLFDLIVAEDQNAVLALFQRLARHLKKIVFSSDQEIMQLFFQIRIPIKNAREHIVKEEDVIPLPDYRVDATVGQLMNALQETALKLCQYSLERKKLHRNSIRKEILCYIREQYADGNLCAAMIADHFGISEKYVFKAIKEETGLALGKYVENIRMGRARELLEGTSLSAAEISRMVGYESITTFYKTFNRVFGIAPIALRESLREDREKGQNREKGQDREKEQDRGK